MAKTHVVRCSNRKLKNVTTCASQAIKMFCTECLGWDGNPKTDCDTFYCPLFPYRGKVLSTVTGTIDRETYTKQS